MPRKERPKTDEKPDFEGALAELEKLVEALEEGDLSLEASLQHFERGIALTRQCQQALKAAEQKVDILMQRDGAEETEPFDDGD